MKEKSPSTRPSALSLMAYSAPSMIVSLAVVPVTAVLPTLYAQHALLSVSAVGAILLMRSVYDAFSDQLIGYLSDRTRSRLGARLPWIIAGSVVTIISVLALFRIPPDAGIVYFASWTIVFFTGTTMVGIPHYAWGHELSPDYKDRSRVFAFKGFFDNIGTMMFSMIPIVLVFFGLLQTTEYTVDTVWLLGLIVAVALPLSVAAAGFYAPLGHTGTAPRTSVRGLLLSVKNNKPFQRFILAYVIAGTGYGFLVALFYPFISTYLKIGHAFPHVLLAVTLCALVSIPIWVRIVHKIGKHRAWAWGWLANSFVLVPMIWVSPGESSIVPAMIIMGVYGLTNGVSAIAPFAILSDVIDYDILKTGTDRGGNYFAFMMLAVKMLGSTGGIALIVLGSVFGYQVADDAVNTKFANMGMLWMFVAAPAVFQLASLPLIWNFPIDEQRHNIIRRRIQRRGSDEKIATMESS